MDQIEILAPVGNYQMLEAGIAAGADSFYLALDNFGARAYAENFTLENIKEIIDFIHLFSKKVFITTNTLIKDKEMSKAIAYVEKLYEYGADALIVQDLGFFSIIKDRLPGMELHASTQMAVRDYYGAKYLASLGFDRIVIARETPIEEIEKIAQLPCENEVFVHGSLCVSYSGECLMSSYFGARSANRGRCAGPCRQKYELISENKTLANDYFLNMKDLNTIDNIDKLLLAGVDSIKIEGRMKTPEYVYTSVSNYKSKIYDNYYNKARLDDSSNRGYTKGFIFDQRKDYILLEDMSKHRTVGKVHAKGDRKYFVASSDLAKGDNLQIITQKDKKLPYTTTRAYKARDMVYLDKYKDAKLGSDVLVLNSVSLKKSLEESLNSYKNLKIELFFKAFIDQYPILTLRYKDHQVTYTHGVKVQKAQNISLSQDDIRENLSKFNDEIFTPSTIDVKIDQGIFLRKKDINECRRQGVNLLKAEILKASHRNPIEIPLPDHKIRKTKTREKNIELLTNNISRELLDDYDKVYIRSYDQKYRGLDLYLILDSHEDYQIDSLIAYLKTNDIGGVIINNYKDLNFIEDFKKNKIKIRIGRYLNVFNSYTYDFYKDFAESICASVESDLETIKANAKKYRVEALAYGRIELMNMRHCPFSSIKKCALKGCETCKFSQAQLRSHDGELMKVIRYGDYSKIYPENPINFDIDDLANDISLLYQVMDDSDLNYINKARKSKSYQQGVL